MANYTKQVTNVAAMAREFHLQYWQVRYAVMAAGLKPVKPATQLDRRCKWYPRPVLERTLRAHFPQSIQAS